MMFSLLLETRETGIKNNKDSIILGTKIIPTKAMLQIMSSLLKIKVTLPLSMVETRKAGKSIKDITILGIKMIPTKAMLQMVASLLLEIKVTQQLKKKKKKKTGNKNIKDII